MKRLFWGLFLLVVLAINGACLTFQMPAWYVYGTLAVNMVGAAYFLFDLTNFLIRRRCNTYENRK